MTAPIDNKRTEPVQHPYQNRPVEQEDFEVHTKETKWFEEQIQKWDDLGYDTNDAKALLETNLKYNSDVYNQKVEEDKQKSKETNESWCNQQ